MTGFFTSGSSENTNTTDHVVHEICRDPLNHMIGDAKNKGRKGLILTCKDRLIHYYAKFGYKNMGVSESVHGGAVWYDMILEFGAQES